MMRDNLITSTYWGSFRGRDVFLFRITGPDRSYVELTNYGGTVVSIVVPDRNNQPGHVVLGFPTLEGYLLDDCYLGSTVGPFANRIANGRFSIDGVGYELDTNDGVHSNHSGSAGFNSKVFEYQILDSAISFSYLSPDQAGGFPGELDVVLTYTWKDMELVIDYRAETNRKTPVNITNHCYFNLSGTGSMLDQELTILTNHYLETAPDHIPTGRICSSEQLMFCNTKIASRLEDARGSLKGLNTCFVLEASAGQTPRKAAELYDPDSGRVLEVFTTYPGLLLYTGDYLRTKMPGHYNKTYEAFDGLCLECQYFPDAPNHPEFPSTILQPDQLYQQQICYRFHVES
jgi:aldose 1-epimerase